VAGCNTDALELRAVVVVRMPSDLDDSGFALDGDTDPGINIMTAVLHPELPARLCISGVREQPERVQRRGHVPLDQEAVHELGKPIWGGRGGGRCARRGGRRTAGRPRGGASGAIARRCAPPPTPAGTT
jgi:hypothetical protein